jgi:calcineurin-like phosphoesterase
LLFLGDVVGEPGRSAVQREVPQLKEELGLDFVVVNGENAAAGRGTCGSGSKEWKECKN